MINRDWKEPWVDRMGLVVALSGEDRFTHLQRLKRDMAPLAPEQQAELRECFRQRFTPSNGADGCQSATQAVREVM